ncbi:conserved hypothetical protein [Sulfolobus islandicus Y.G.57.14]|uniref:Uncharacterized protein n=9 Tax=Saccharolobus islandicus TaxID=43080 RepID=M9UFK9_SACIS|nr:hypothetical protein [Sulfolobus islandicus]ACP36251.1 conserved hypothetical protein [Sulfolobus islandicus L.S.2.15]ACP38841.1 conserved hypothetical protein [Sulfolobus islandicus M.14.25]ACP46479.1 conserved hypothetical protein [Sulfolobus islandicus Y.G.57.14]ACP47815.1 conserved hypothetical protein [Sulfolobus islandicus Y.N.15.51]ACP56046.1 conserved hypothetical protein [Sulfolobus islandicus M.16.27]
MLLYFKPVKKERDINVALEIVSELFASKVGKLLGLPIPEVFLIEYGEETGLLMDYLPDKASKENISNLDEIKMSLAFEEWILNIDLKEDHVLSKNGKGFIIDHGHSLSAWKPLYYIIQIIDKKVSRFNLWANEDDFKNGIELLSSIDYNMILNTLKESFSEVVESNFCKLLTKQVIDEYTELNLKILEKRMEYLKGGKILLTYEYR